MLALGLLMSGLQRLYSWWTTKSTRDQLLENLDEARLFEEWEASAYQLDEVSGLDLWYTSLHITVYCFPNIGLSQASEPNLEALRLPPHL